MMSAQHLRSAPGCFDARRLERVFARCFLHTYHTRLRGGGAEPLYQPAADSGELHIIWYREDYFASALHEVAHWCIAGPERRRQPDFGYWYAPEGRGVEQQAAFEAVECEPQALEWYFSEACGYRFRLSADNLDQISGTLQDNSPFAAAVARRARAWQSSGLPRRAEQYFCALADEFGTALTPGQLPFCAETLT